MRKRRQLANHAFGIGVSAVLALGGCTRITHSPQCPQQAGVGETVNIGAVVANPGAVPRYLWEVIPTGAGTFADEHSVVTTFTPSAAGQITLQLGAADGLFMYINQCIVEVISARPEVSLLVNPEEAVIGNSVLMTCTSVGDEPAAGFTITQTTGETVELTPILPGIVAFDADTVGTFTFECVGTSTNGVASEPVVGTTTVTEGGRVPGRGGGR